MGKLTRFTDPTTNKTLTDVELIFNTDSFDTVHDNEWEGEVNPDGHSRLNEQAWIDRYEYEASLIFYILKNNPNIKNILELGSGPGVLSQHILKKYSQYLM